MSAQQQDAPPSYQQATGSSTASSRLQVPQEHNGIPAAARRSMEDEHRPLPPGWLRQWDSKEQHQFFVDTKANPPRSIWHHPYDDDDFLKTLSAEERERIQEQERDLKTNPYPDEKSSKADTSSRPDAGAHSQSFSAGAGGAPEISSSSSTTDKKEKGGFGRRLKDKVTGTTHEERQQDRAQRAEEERQYYEAHMRFRTALQRAQMTGQPQFFAKDRDGRDIYVEPPQAYGNYGRGSYGYNPYAQGPYADPNARFIRPQGPYGRPYGPAYGGGMGLPIAGGLLGGMLLGGLLF